MKRVLLVIDMQNDFVTGALGSARAAAIVGNIRELVKQYREAGDPVLFTLDTHTEQDYATDNPSQESARIPKHCIEGTEGWNLVPELCPLAGDADCVKKPAFLSPTLADVVHGRYGEDVSFTLCGVCTDICVVSNALALRGAFARSPIAVRADLCAGTNTQNHEAALAVMRSCLVDVR